MIILHKAGIDEDAIFVSLSEDEGKGEIHDPFVVHPADEVDPRLIFGARIPALSHCHGGERKASTVQGFSGCCDGGPPCVHRHSAKRAVRFGRGEMTLDVEDVVDGGMR
jgi:hypothetical protein